MTLLAGLRTRDPDLLNLRKATRVTIVSVALLAALEGLLDHPSLSIFAFFGCFVGLVIADFGGPRWPKALAYAAMVVICDLLIAVGSLLSDSRPANAAAMFVVVFAASFASVFGGYTPAFIAPVALAYSLAVLDPLSQATIEIRLLGWALGGTVALLAAIFLWPVDQRLRLRQTLAKVCANLADALTSVHDLDTANVHLRQATDAIAEAHRKASAPLRPVGTTSRRIGLLHLVEDLELAVDMTGRVLEGGWKPDTDEQLVAACAHAFRQSAAMLKEEIDVEIGAKAIERLDDARMDWRRTDAEAATESISPDTEGDGGIAEALRGMHESFPAMVVSHVAIWVTADAATALGRVDTIGPKMSAPELSPTSDQATDMTHRAWRIAFSEFDPDGVVFRNSMRAALAMTFAVVLAQALPIAHAFWITLGALSVLRSSAASTSASALQSIAGTLIGFVVSGVVLTEFGTNTTLLWLILPFGVFLAGYTPGAIGFVVGQASFTIMMVIVFTLIDNQGITTDFVRLETVSLGAVSSAIVGLILWPRGARTALAHASAAVYRAASDATRVLLTGSADDREVADGRIRSARRRADEAFGVALNERGQHLDTQAWITLSRAPNMVHSLLAGLVRQPAPWLFDTCRSATEALVEHRDSVAGALGDVADRLDRAAPNATQRPRKNRPGELVARLEDCLDLSSPNALDRLADAGLLTVWDDALSNLNSYIVDAEPALDHVTRVTRPRAWLHRSARKANENPGSAEKPLS